MSASRLEVAIRHGALRARIAEQRADLTQHVAPLEAALGGADKALAGVDWLKHHPAAVAAAVVVLVVASPKRAWRWGKRGFLVWRSWQTVRKSLLGTR
ncbi:YqjK-like family protein [Dechloromonas sp. H13]|uniref:YqjK-like family protein n=1 Tax=Dechloromonas sp. H13 TaxID=2570193 RepID=UPI001884C7C6|nr:YqjK-like family protein [Dechloromonas sp. H13]